MSRRIVPSIPGGACPVANSGMFVSVVHRDTKAARLWVRPAERTTAHGWYHSTSQGTSTMPDFTAFCLQDTVT